MPHFSKPSIAVILLPIGLFAGSCLIGCEGLGDRKALRLPSLLADRLASGDTAADSTDGASLDATAVRAVLARDTDSERRSVWVRAVTHSTEATAASSARWRYPDLDDLLARPPASQPDWRKMLSDKAPIVATHAAIALARLGDPAGAERLARAVQSPELTGAMRCAAVEALARLDAASCVTPLRELADQYGRVTPEAASVYRPDLHAELIRGLARHVDPADDPRFTTALRSRAADVRLEALLAWAEGHGGTLPVEVEDLRSDGDRRVRMAALRALGRRHPEGQRYLADALSDHDLSVRIAAIATLGESADEESRTLLHRQLYDPSEAIRAEAVAALAHSGDAESVRRAADDRSWRVRLKVAEALGRDSSQAAVALVRRLLDDRSAEVQRQVILALAEWPLERAGPVLLDAFESPNLMTRHEARDRLAAEWPVAAAFPLEATPQRRQEVLDGLREQFRRQYAGAIVDVPVDLAGEKPPTRVSPEVLDRVEQLVTRRDVAGLRDFGPELIEAMDRLVHERNGDLPEWVYRDVLPRHGPEYAALARLISEDVFERRRAAADLAELARQTPLGRLAVARLARLGVAEPDDLVWHGLFGAVADDGSEPSIRLAYAGLSHPSAEVRRRACVHLAAHPDPAHARMLLPNLEDDSEPVVLAAVRALGFSGGPVDVEPLRRVLRIKSEPLRLETARALVRLDDAMGLTTLEQLAHSGDPKIRCHVAEALGETGQSTAVPILVGLLDDRPAVCSAALESLARLVGRDVSTTGEEPATTPQRVARWKEWFAQHPDVAAYQSGHVSRQ